MKLRKVLYLMVGMALCWGFSSCQDDDYGFSSDHTDASSQVVGTFTGNIYNSENEVVASDVIASIEKINESTVQAVAVAIKAASIEMDLTANFNAAKAGENRYILNNGNSSTKVGEATRNSAGVLEGNTLTMYVTLNSKYKWSTASAAKRYTLVLLKN